LAVLAGWRTGVRSDHLRALALACGPWIARQRRARVLRRDWWKAGKDSGAEPGRAPGGACDDKARCTLLQPSLFATAHRSAFPAASRPAMR